MSPRLRVVEHRGADLVENIFDALAKTNGYRLLPPDYRSMYERLDRKGSKLRVICDFIACMTDRYALEFSERLTAVGASFFKPF
jgi:dGTPase